MDFWCNHIFTTIVGYFSSFHISETYCPYNNSVECSVPSSNRWVDCNWQPLKACAAGEANGNTAAAAIHTEYQVRYWSDILYCCCRVVTRDGIEHLNLGFGR